MAETPQQPQASAAGGLNVRRLVDWSVLGGLPLASLLSGVVMLFTRYIGMPVWLELGVDFDGLRGLALGWGWQLLWTAAPLVCFLLAFGLLRSTVLRVSLGVVVFHLWLVAFMLVCWALWDVAQELDQRLLQ